jgi:hypothetical protein
MDTAPQTPPQNAATPPDPDGKHQLSGNTVFKLAHRISDGVNGVRIQLAKRWKFVPQTIAYQGYGSTSLVRVLGRVLLTQKPLPGSKAEFPCSSPTSKSPSAMLSPTSGRTGAG